MVIIERINSLAIDRLSALVAEADATGFHGLVRLVEDWRSGLNRFNEPGEALFLASDEGAVVGVCGLNCDPYLDDPMVGRVRHLYVAVVHRRKEIGTRLVRAAIGAARGQFAQLRLRSDSPIADAFYRSLGFMPVIGEPACSHEFILIDED
jgi:GNAT superfamily N-acetyltransferase